MRRLSLALLAMLTLVGCGTTVTVRERATPQPAVAPAHCNPAPGTGTMGICVPPAGPTLVGRLPTFAEHALVPDVSEFQSCALHSEAIFRVYEAGTEREDTTARCHARELARLHAWAAVYAFERAGHGGCVVQADRTVAIVRRLPVEVQVVVGDSEVGLHGGFDRCFEHEVERQGYPAVEYTCPGCGDEQVGRIWIAAYPFRPPGVWVAHQFSESFLCRGIVGDCSIDEGILAIHRINRGPLIARREVLRRVLIRYGCRRRVAEHQHLGPRCRRWFAEGDRLARALARQ